LLSSQVIVQNIWKQSLCLTSNINQESGVGVVITVHTFHIFAQVYCGHSAVWIKMPLRMDLGLHPGYILLDGDPAPLKGAQQLQFSAHVYCGQTAGWINIPVGMEVGLGQAALCWMETQPPPPERGTAAPCFSAQVYWGQTAGWIKVPLYGGRPWPRRHWVTWPPCSPKKAHGSPHFLALSFVAKWWMDQDATWQGVGLSPSDIVLDGDPAPSPEGCGAPSFWPMSIAAKRLKEWKFQLVRK